MATKQYYATGSFKYGTRMMQAGDPVQMDAPTARLFNALKKITDKRPRLAAPPKVEVPAEPKPPRKRRQKKA